METRRFRTFQALILASDRVFPAGEGLERTDPFVYQPALCLVTLIAGIVSDRLRPVHLPGTEEKSKQMK